LSKLRGLFLLSLLALSSFALGQEADLGVSKTGPEQSAADTDVMYTVTVFNGGPDDAAGITLNDPIPAGMTFVSADTAGAPGFVCSDPGVGSGGLVSCTGATLASGSSAVFVFVFHIGAGTPPGTFFTNIATVVSGADPNSENDSGVATTVTPFPPQTDVFAQKQGPSFAGPDTDVVYTLTVGNNGPDPATLSFEDTLPGTMTFVSLVQNSGPVLNCDTPAIGAGGTILCDALNYPAGSSSTFTLTGHIPAGTSSGTTYTNTVTVSAEEDDPTPANDSASTLTTVSATDVSVVKTGPANVNAGDITYTITVANAGPDSATSTQLFDPLPVDTTFVSLAQDNGPAALCSTPAVGDNGDVVCSWPALASGASAQFTLVIHSGSNSTVINTASVSSQTFDSDSSNDEDSVTTTVTPVADLSVLKDGPLTIPAGSNITYTVSVTNNGPSHASTVSVEDILAAGLTFVSADAPAGWSCVTPAVGANGTITCSAASLLEGETADFTFVVHLTSSATVGGTVSNTATVSTATSDSNSGNDSSTTQGTVTPALPTDVSISKTADSDNYVVGSTVTYTIVVTNTGTSDALDTVVTDTIPAGTTFESATSTQGSCSGTTTVTCTIGTLVPDASAMITLQVVLPNTPGTFVNTASVAISNGDSNPANDASTATILSSAQIAAIPTLSPFALALLGLAFSVAGFLALRGRL